MGILQDIQEYLRIFGYTNNQSGDNVRRHLYLRRQQGDDVVHHYGYEHYWKKPDELASTSQPEAAEPGVAAEPGADDDNDNENVTMMCNIRCPKVYQNSGEVCGKTVGPNKTYMYHTFTDFCQLEQQNCLVLNWTFAYKGQCFDEFPTWSLYAYPVLKRKIQYVKAIFGASTSSTKDAQNSTAAPVVLHPSMIDYGIYG